MIVYHQCDKADGEQPDGGFIFSVRLAQRGAEEQEREPTQMEK